MGLFCALLKCEDRCHSIDIEVTGDFTFSVYQCFMNLFCVLQKPPLTERESRGNPLLILSILSHSGLFHLPLVHKLPKLEQPH